MSNIIKFDPSKLSNAFKKAAAEVAPKGAFLKMSKAGEWTYGADETEVAATDQFAVNPEAVMHGWVCWADTDAGAAAGKLGEVMVPITDDAPQMPSAVPPGGAAWAVQLGLHLKGLTGVAKGLDLLYTTTSYGGKKAVSGLMSEMGEHFSVKANHAKPVPVVTLDSSSYKHEKYGKLFNPVITLVKWMEMPKTEAPKKIGKK